MGSNPLGGGALSASVSLPSGLDNIGKTSSFSPLCNDVLSQQIGCDKEILTSDSEYYCFPNVKEMKGISASSDCGLPVSFRTLGRIRAGPVLEEDTKGAVRTSLRFTKISPPVCVNGKSITQSVEVPQQDQPATKAAPSVSEASFHTTDQELDSRLPSRASSPGLYTNLDCFTPVPSRRSSGSYTSGYDIPEGWSASSSGDSTIDPLTPFFGCVRCGKAAHGGLPCSPREDASATPLSQLPKTNPDPEPQITKVLETPAGQVMIKHVKTNLEELLTTLTSSFITNKLGIPLKIAAGGAVCSLALQIASFFVTDNVASLVLSATSLATSFMSLGSILYAMYECKLTEEESNQLAKLYTAYITKQANPPQGLDDLPPPPDYVGPQPSGFTWRGLVCAMGGLIVPIIAYATGLNVVNTLRDWFYADRGISAISKNVGELWDTVTKFFVNTQHDVYKKWHQRACALRFALDTLQLKPFHDFLLDVKEEIKLDETLAEAESFHVTPYGFDTKDYPDFNNASLALVTAINEVKNLQREIRRVKTTASQKQVPVMVLFIGAGGHGKSHLMHHLCKELLERNGYPPAIWHPSLAGNFMNYHGEYGAVVDELLPPTKAQTGQNSVVNLITSLVSQNPTNLEGAGLTEKNNPAQLKFIMAATNTELADFDQFTNAETAKAFFSKMLILRVEDPLYNPERGREDQPHRMPDYSHLQLSILKYEMHTDRHKKGERVALPRIKEMLQRQHQIVHQDYLKTLSDAINMKPQSESPMGAFVVMLTGPTGVGKTSVVTEARQDFIDGTNMTPQHVLPGDLPKPKHGFYIFDDYFDEDNIKNRGYVDQYVKFVNSLPTGSIVLNITNWKPKELSWMKFLQFPFVSGAREYPFHAECVARRFGLTGNFVFQNKVVTCGSLQNAEFHMGEDGTIFDVRSKTTFAGDDFYQQVVSRWMLYLRSCTRLRTVKIPRIDLARKREKMTPDIVVIAPSMEELKKSVCSLSPLGKYVTVNVALSQFTKAAACRQLLPREGENLQDTMSRAIAFLKVTASNPSIFFSVGDLTLLYDGTTIYVESNHTHIEKEEVYVLTYIPNTKHIMLRNGTQPIQSISLLQYITFRALPTSAVTLSPEWCHPDVVKQLNGLIHHFSENYPSFSKDYTEALREYHATASELWWKAMSARFMEFIKNHPLYAIGGLVFGLISITATGYAMYSVVKALIPSSKQDSSTTPKEEEASSDLFQGKPTPVQSSLQPNGQTVVDTKNQSKVVRFEEPLDVQKKRSTKARIAAKARNTIGFSFPFGNKNFRWHPGKGSFISGDAGDPDWDRLPHDERDGRENFRLVEELRREWEREDNMKSAIEELQSAVDHLSAVVEFDKPITIAQFQSFERQEKQMDHETTPSVVKAQSVVGIEDAIQPLRSPIQHAIVRIENNVVFVTGYSPDGLSKFSARGIAITSNFVLCNAHLDGGGKISIQENRNGEVECVVHHKSVTRDLMLLRTEKTLSHMKDIVNNFANEADVPAIYKGVTIRYLPDGQILETYGAVVRRSLTRLITALDGSDMLSTTGYALVKAAEGPNASIPGDCGSPYISAEGLSLGKIFAIHIGLTHGLTLENEPTGVLVSKEDINALINRTLTVLHNRVSFFNVATKAKKWVVPEVRESFDMVVTPEMLSVYNCYVDRSIGPIIIPKHPNIIKIAGGTSWPAPKTPYMHTPFHEEMKALFQTLGLPLKDPVRVGFPHKDVPLDACQRPNPFQRCYVTMARPPGAATKEFMSEVVKDLSAYFANLYKRPQILGEETVLSGGNVEEGIRYDPLELDASAGHTANVIWGLTKMTDCFENCHGKITWKDTPNAQQAKALCDLTLYYAEQGKRMLSVYKACIKMELKDTEKRDKPRIFFSCDLHEKIFVRMIMGYYCAVAQARRTTHHAQVGISGGDDMMYVMNRLLEMSAFGWDEDIKSNDHTMPKMIYDACFELYKLRVKDPYFLNCLDVVCSMVSQPVHAFPGGMVQTRIGIPSGTPITAFLNSDAHFVLMYACWKHRCAERGTDTNLSEFLKNVRPLFYADDGVTAVSPRVLDWWNFIEYARLSKHLFNVEITGSNKDAKLQRCIPVKEFEFVGRHFTTWGGCVYGSLRMQAITGRLLYTRDLSPTHVFCLVQEAILEFVLAGKQDVAEAVLEIYRSKDPELASQIIILPPSVVPLYVHSRVFGGTNKLTRKRLESLGFTFANDEILDVQSKTTTMNPLRLTTKIDQLARKMCSTSAIVAMATVSWPTEMIKRSCDGPNCGCCAYLSSARVDLHPLEVGLTAMLTYPHNGATLKDLRNAVSDPVEGKTIALKFRESLTLCELELLARTQPHYVFSVLLGSSDYLIDVDNCIIMVDNQNMPGLLDEEPRSKYAWNKTWGSFLSTIKEIPIPPRFHMLGLTTYPKPMQADRTRTPVPTPRTGGTTASVTSGGGALASAATPVAAVQPGLVTLDGIAASPAMSDPVNMQSVGMPNETIYLAGGANDLLSRACEWETVSTESISTTMQPGAPLFVGFYNPFDPNISGQYVAAYAAFHKRVVGTMEFRLFVQHIANSGLQIRCGEFDATLLNDTRSNLDQLIQAFRPTVVNSSDATGITFALGYNFNGYQSYERDSPKPTRAWGVTLMSPPVSMFNSYSVKYTVQVRCTPTTQFVGVMPMSTPNTVVEKLNQAFPIDGYLFTDGRIHPHPHRLDPMESLTARAPGTTDGAKINVNPSIGNITTMIKRVTFKTTPSAPATDPAYPDVTYQVLIIRGDIPQELMEIINTTWDMWQRDHPEWMKEPHSVNSLGAFVHRRPDVDEWDVGNVGNSFWGGEYFMRQFQESLKGKSYTSGNVTLPPGLKPDFEVPSHVYGDNGEAKNHPIKYSHEKTVMYVLQPSQNCPNPWVTISTYNVVGMDTHPFTAQTNYWIDAIDTTADYLAVAVSYTPSVFPPQNALLRVSDKIPCAVGTQPTGSPTQPMTPVEMQFLDVCDNLTPDGFKMVITISSIGIGTNDVTFCYWKEARGFYLQTSNVMKDYYKVFSIPLKQMEIRSIAFVDTQGVIIPTDSYNDDQIWTTRESQTVMRFCKPCDNRKLIQNLTPFITLVKRQTPNPKQMMATASILNGLGGLAGGIGSGMMTQGILEANLAQQKYLNAFNWQQRYKMQQLQFEQANRIRHLNQQHNLAESPLANFQAMTGHADEFGHNIGLTTDNPRLHEAINPTLMDDDPQPAPAEAISPLIEKREEED